MPTIAGTCVAFGHRGVLLRGPSGSGKSDLALRLCDRGAILVSDDGVELAGDGDGALIASAPPSIAGLMEVRGLGILEVPVSEPVSLVAVVDLVARAEQERMPEPDSVDLAGILLPRFRLHAFDASAATKVLLAVRLVSGDIRAVR